MFRACRQFSQVIFPLDLLPSRSERPQPSPFDFQDERTDAMGNSKDLKNFRIWMALGTLAIYVFLLVTGNA